MSSGGRADASASASKSKQLKRKKNAAGSRKDPGWEYATDIDGDSKKTKCKFCSKVFSGGIFRFKHHLARTKENVEPCLSVPDDVRKQMLDILDLNLEAKEARKNLLHRGINITAAASATGSQETIYSTLGASGSNSLPPTRTQTTMSTLLKKDLRRDAAKSIARWFYLTGTAFNAAREPKYYTMFELAARHGPGFKPPSYHEIRETLLKEELEEVESKLSIFRNEWTKVGCSIMSDGWTDRKRRSICNFLVNSPKGTVFIESLDTSHYSKNTQKVFEMLDDVVEKVGEENVIQVITDNASAYKAAGAKLMEKRQHLFWTPCAAHCLEVLRLVDSDELPSMPFLYLELNQAMEKIKSNFSNIEKR
ncbi:hypothetical protein LINPERHAP2_LOCUS37467 [Linum perenne]